MDDVVVVQVLDALLQVMLESVLLSTTLAKGEKGRTRRWVMTLAASPSVNLPLDAIFSNSSPPDASWNAR